MRIPITSLEDPALTIYRDLRHHDVGRRGTRFIVEGETVVRRLIDSDFEIDSILAADRKYESLAAAAPEAKIYTGPNEVVDALLGFKFHSGVMACAVRKPSPDLRELVRSAGEKQVIVCCPELTDGANLGSIVRLTAAFGGTALLLGPSCRDPFFRQSVRVSMGTIFKLPIVRSEDLLGDLRLLRDEAHFDLVAAVLDADATELRHAPVTPRTVLLFGNEAPGLPREVVAAGTRKLVIPMRPGVDSLNVAVSAGIFLHHFMQ